MKSTLLIALMCGLSCLTMAVSSAAAEEDKTPKVGDLAPSFELIGSDGKKYKLADFKGKKGVVVAWFPKAFTGG